MKYNIHIPLVFSILFLSSFLYAQNSGDYIKATKAFDKGEFGKAEGIYKKAYSRSNDRSEKNEISYRLAQCYFYLGNYKKAESNFRRTLKMRYKNPMIHFYLAECYKAMEKFDKADQQYNIFIEKDPNNEIGQKALVSLNLARDWIEAGSKYRVVNAGNVLNSKQDDFSPFFRDKKNKELYFSSSRDGVLGKNINQKTGQMFTDIFSVKKVDSKGKGRKRTTKKTITPPEWDEQSVSNVNDGLKDVVNLKNSEEGVITFNKRGNRMLFTRAVFKKNKYQGRRIYSAKFRGKKFRDVTMEVIPVDTLVDVHGPSLSSDEKTLFFAAEIEGGFGGTDLYVSKYDRRKKAWGEPENLGPNVNSSGNEGFPYYSGSTKNLYFASDGRVGMGGLDIYKATPNLNSTASENLFNEAENLQYPVNTCYDDFGIMFETYSQAENEPELKGYFSSNRVGNKWRSKGNTDIYYFDKQQIFFQLSGQVVDVADNSPIKGAEIELIGPSSSKVAHTDGFGNFSFDESNFKEGEDYRLVVNKEWFFQQIDTTITTINIPKKDCSYIEDGSPREGNLLYEIYRGPIEMKTMRRPLVLKSVLFDLGKSDLRPKGKEELDSLASLLTKDWPNVVVELRSHTDLRGSDTLNARLSFDRAKSCVDYLVSQGVNIDRLIPLGMADTEPKVLEVSTDGLSEGQLDAAYINKLRSKRLKELAHQKNRRTDFKILSNDFKKWIKDNPQLSQNQTKKVIQNASIDKDGNIKPNTKGNFIEQVN